MAKKIEDTLKKKVEHLKQWNVVKITSLSEDGRIKISNVNVTVPDKEHECIFGVRNPLICIKCPKYYKCVSAEPIKEKEEEVELGGCGKPRCSDDPTACLLCPQCIDKEAYKKKIEASGISIKVDPKKEKIHKIVDEFNKGLISAEEAVKMIEAIRRGEEIKEIKKEVPVEEIIEKLNSTVKDYKKGSIDLNKATSLIKKYADEIIDALQKKAVA